MDNEVKIIREQHSIKLIKGQRGSYGWEIKVYGEDANAIVNALEKIDKKMVSKFSQFSVPAGEIE